MWVDLGCVGYNVYMCAHGDPHGSSSAVGQETQNFKFEPGLLSHYEDVFVR